MFGGIHSLSVELEVIYELVQNSLFGFGNHELGYESMKLADIPVEIRKKPRGSACTDWQLNWRLLYELVRNPLFGF